MKYVRSKLFAPDRETPSPVGFEQKVFCVLLFVAFSAYALFFLDHRSPWYDEFLSLKSADPELTLSFLLPKRMALDVHPPLYFIILHYWLGLFGNTLETARSLNLLALALSAVAAIWAIRKRLLDGMWPLFCGLFLTSHFAVFYIHDGRAYALLLTGSLILFLLLLLELRNIREHRPTRFRYFLGLGCAAAATSFLHYFGFLFAGLVLLVLLGTEALAGRRKEASIVLLIGAIIFAAMAGWLAYVYAHAGEIPRAYWIADYPMNYGDVFLRHMFSNNVLLALATLGSIFISLPKLMKRADIRAASAILLFLVLIPAAISLLQPITVPRYFIVAMPPLFYVIGVAYREAAFSRPVQALFFVLLAVSPFWNMDDVLISKSQWRASAEKIRSIDACHTATIAANPSGNSLYTHGYFFRDRKVNFVALQRDQLAAVTSDSCPVLLWSMEYGWDEITPQFETLGLDPKSLTIFHFNNGFVVLEPEN